MAKTLVTEQRIDPTWTVYAAPLIAILQTAEQIGIQQTALLDNLSFRAGDLNVPDRRFPVTDYFKLYQAVYDISGDADIGLAVGRISFLKGMNLQLYMATVSKQFRDYLNLIPSVIKLRGDIGQVGAYRNADSIELRWEPLLLDTARKRFYSDEILAASAAIINSLCVLPVPILNAQFTYPEPPDKRRLEAIFGSDLAFDQPCSSLFFNAEALNYPLLQQDYHQGADLKQPFRDFFGNDNPSDQLLLNLKQSILQYLPEGEVTIDKLASKLHVSRRTLQRRLSDRGTSFLHVLQEVRSRAALRYLSDNRLGITEIAFLLGYADQGSFSSAFKSWHGMSPRDYRRG